MPAFSQNEINEAKRRVEDMRRRSYGYSQPESKSETPDEVLPAVKTEPERKPSQSSGMLDGLLGGLFKNEDTALILILILILYREKADSSLILALLYILL